MKYIRAFLQVAFLAVAVIFAARGRYDAASYNLLMILVIEFTQKDRGGPAA